MSDPIKSVEDEIDTNLLPFPVVGVGASAGGVEALLDLFGSLPADTGMAFVIVLHLAPDQKSHLAEILARKTSMPVSEVENDTRPEPNHVYVLPPKTFVSLSRGTLELIPRPEAPRVPMPIDHFFRSLGADQKNRAVGVVLSGSDSDGALGLKAIKGEGGIAIVQHPDSARFPEMPRNSIAAEHVDLVVPPSQIGLELAKLAGQFRAPQLRPLEDGDSAKDEESELSHVLNLLRSVSGVDFRLYKPSTIRRRIARRMVLKQIEGLPDYVKFLQRRPEELHQLHEEALINVTQFFRDPEVFEALKTGILPRIFDERSGDRQVRFWVAGCSTGEEVYSLAICLLEYLPGLSYEPAIQIFATDASDRSIEKARVGIYPHGIAADVSPERLRRFFSNVDNGLQISKRLRELCIFARQNLCSDPPFSKLDFISCRNVLIYFGQALQQRVFATFNYALRPAGYLLLGKAESVLESADLFKTIDRRHKLYAKIASPTPAHFDFAQPPAPKLDKPLPSPGAGSSQEADIEASARHRRFLAQLQQDLTTTRLYLQSLMEERGISSQELISTNEEIQSSNEELQSANEELETAKEELQSSNEELQTLNDELSQRNTSLTQTTNDLANLFASVNIPVLMLSDELRIRQFTPPTQRLLNVRDADIGRPIGDFRLNLNVENIEPILQDVLDTTAAREMQVQDRDGCWHLLRILPYRTPENKIEGVVLVLVDITAQKQAERVLERDRERLEGRVESTVHALERTQEELRALSASLFTAQENERRRVARELHDDISQKLAVFGMDLERLRQSLPEDSEAHALAGSLYTRAAGLSDDVRQISHKLHPSILDDLGLPSALKALCSEFGEREGMVVTFSPSGVPDRIPQDIAGTLYRLTQEALRNVEKHAGKTHVKIRLEGTQEGIRLEIADFGVGFNTEETHGGLGLVSMSERARLMQGRFSVQSARGKGTTVTVEVPLSSSAANA